MRDLPAPDYACIYLQPHQAGEGEHTWCVDRIEDDDIEYVRADLHAEFVAAVTAFTDALKAEKAGAMLDLRNAERLASKAMLTLSRIPDIQIKGAA